jgi:UDP-glucose 4-epimerase
MHLTMAIVGGAGFIGSHYTRDALRKYPNAKVLIIDNFSSGTQNHIRDLADDERVTVCPIDLKDLDKLTETLSGVDLVVHFAANPDIAAAATRPDIDFWNGTFLTQNLLEAMRINQVKYLLYTSGSGVYGEADVEFGEDYGPCMPISTYGASKIACEALISSYCHMFGLKARAFRFANVVGPAQTHGVVYDFLRKLKKNPEALHVLGNGSQTKAYIHVQDVILAMNMVLNDMLIKSGDRFDIFNVATDDYISVSEIAGIVIDQVSPDAAIEFGSSDRGWLGDVPKVKFNTQKIKNLGWRSSMNTANAIKSSLKAMLNEDWNN